MVTNSQHLLDAGSPGLSQGGGCGLGDGRLPASPPPGFAGLENHPPLGQRLTAFLSHFKGGLSHRSLLECRASSGRTGHAASLGVVARVSTQGLLGTGI